MAEVDAAAGRSTHPRHANNATVRFLFALILAALLLPSATALAQDPPKLPPIFRDAVPETGPRWSGEPVSMSLRDADLVETLRTFSRLGDFNLLIQPGVRGKVTVELKEVPWDQAMSMILRMHGLGMELTQGTIRIGKPAELARWAKEDARSPSIREAIKQRLRVTGDLEYIDPALVVQLLEYGYLTERGRAIADGRTLSVEDEGDRLRRVARLVARLDIAEARRDDLSQLRRRATLIWPDTSRR